MTTLAEIRLEKMRKLRGLRAARDEVNTKRMVASLPTPGLLAHYLNNAIINTPALDLLDRELEALHTGEAPSKRLVWSLAPQQGKSQRVSRTFPLWTLLRNPECRIVIASYEFGIARRWGREIRNDIRSHPELGLTVSSDSKAAYDWRLEGHQGGVYCVGIGGPLTGRPADLLIIDDPVKGRSEADSESYRNTAYEWWQSTASTRLSPSAPVIIIMTRWHEDDLAGRLLREHPQEWREVNVPTLCDSLPDPLGRGVGEYLESARGLTTDDWMAKRKEVGERDWTALYQGRPSPAEGGLFKRHWWQVDPSLRAIYHDGVMEPLGLPYICTSWDMAFKDTDGSDFVVGQVWGRNGSDCWLLDQVRGRWDFPATVGQFRALAMKWPSATAHYVEDKANGPAVIAQLRHEIAGIVPITPKDSKLARASAISPYIEAGNVHIPSRDLAPWIDTWLEEMASFPLGAHDDQVDAMTQAVSRLLADRGSADDFMRELLASRNRY